jgi:hypothetical protein
MVNMMDTEQLTNSAERMLLEFDEMAKELTPHIERILNQVKNKSVEFDAKKDNFNKEINSGARTTRHRLHL